MTIKFLRKNYFKAFLSEIENEENKPKTFGFSKKKELISCLFFSIIKRKHFLLGEENL